MSEFSSDRVGLVIKALGPVLVLAGLVFGVVQFRITANQDRVARQTQYDQSIAEAKREAKKPFYETQLTLYLEVTNVVSRIAVPLNDKDRDEAIVRFWQLYWGQLAMVESPEVASAMVDFKNVLEDTSLSDAEKDKRLTGETIKLSRRCRDSLRKSWDVDLPELTDR